MCEDINTFAPLACPNMQYIWEDWIIFTQFCMEARQIDFRHTSDLFPDKGAPWYSMGRLLTRSDR